MSGTCVAYVVRPRTLGRIAHAVVATGGMGHDVLIAGANGQIVRALFDAFNRRDLDGILSCLDRDVSYEMGAGVEQWAFPEAAEPTRGHAAIAAFYRRTWPVMEEARADPLELVEDGDRVTVTLAMSVRLARTGPVRRWRDPHAPTLRDGKIVHDEIHTERGQAQQTLN